MSIVNNCANVAEELKQRIVAATEREQSLVVEILSLMPTISDDCRQEVLGFLDRALRVAKKNTEQSSNEYKRVVLDSGQASR